jgi:Amino acid permease
VLSQLLGAVAGKGIFYGVSIGSILVVLALSANTAFADFPRLGRAIAENGFLPHGFTMRGRRLVYTQGVYALAMLTGTLLIVFDGVTDRLIPLYAVGAFLAFTLSQAGMVMHWKRVRGPGSAKNMFVNGLGAFATGLTVIVVLIAKFTEGAWITLLLIPGLIVMMLAVRRHYDHVAAEVNKDSCLTVGDLRPPLVVIAIDRWSRITNKGMRFAMSISPDIVAVHVKVDQESDTLASRWEELVEKPARQAGLTPARLVVLESRYRFVVRPILDFVLDLEKNTPQRYIAVLIPELVERRWHLRLMHNHRSAALKTLLLFQGDKRIMVINIPWYLTE